MSKSQSQQYGLDAVPRFEGDYVVECDQLASGYGDTLILHDISVNFPRGKITCIIGGSGSGKSTLLRSLVGLVSPRRGSVKVLGEDLASKEGEERAAILQRVGFMFQYGALLASNSIMENLSIPVRAHTDLPPAIVDRMVRYKLNLVHLTGAEPKLPGELSGGMRKRAGFARAMMLDPELMFCDEPSAGLDPITMADLDNLLLRLKDQLNMTMIVVTHELASIRNIADLIVMLVGGRVHFFGTLEEADASDDPTLRDFFDRRTESAGGDSRSLLEIMSASGGKESS